MKASCHVIKVGSVLFLIAAVLACIIALAGCSALDKEEGEYDDLAIVDAGFSLDNDSAWATFRNDGDKVYKDVQVCFLCLDEEGNNADDNVGEFTIDIPFVEPGAEYTVGDRLASDSFTRPVSDVKIWVRSRGHLAAGNDDYVVMPELKGADVYFDGSYVSFSITNDSDTDYEYYDIYYLFKDSDGKYCAAEKEIREGIPARGTVTVEAWPDHTGSDIDVFVIPYSENQNEIYRELG